MIWIGFIVAFAVASCEVQCYATCLTQDSLNKCSQKCCQFDNILFENGKVYYFDGKERIELEIEDIHYEMPKKVDFVPRPKQEPVLIAKNNYESLSNTLPGNKCEQKCNKFCRTADDGCYEDCNKKYCATNEKVSGPNYYLFAFFSVIGIFLVKWVVTPKNYEEKYYKLD